VTVRSVLSNENTPAPNVSTERGTPSDLRDKQPEKAAASITESCDPSSNVTLESSEQKRKHLMPMVFKEEGMQIEESEVHFMNAEAPRCESLEPLSKVTVERLLQ
jgi:hypothetical protein